MNSAFKEFKQRINNRFFFKQFLLAKLPAAFFAGLKIELFNEEQAIVSVKQKWFNTNPFRSIYFAVLSMAGEMGTGILSMGHTYKCKPSLSMLVTEQRSVYHKKATGKILFHCNDGNKIANAVEEAINTGNSVSITCYSKGINSSNEIVAECWITWSFKPRINTTIPVAG